MHPHTPATPGMPTEPEPIAQVNRGMRVVDLIGQDIGTVTEVRMPGTAAGTVPDLPPQEADRLAATGYLRVDAAGLTHRTAYVVPTQIAEVSEGDGGVVTLAVSGDELTRAG